MTSARQGRYLELGLPSSVSNSTRFLLLLASPRRARVPDVQVEQVPNDFARGRRCQVSGPALSAALGGFSSGLPGGLVSGKLSYKRTN